jgi:hypothetical protein
MVLFMGFPGAFPAQLPGSVQNITPAGERLKRRVCHLSCHGMKGVFRDIYAAGPNRHCLVWLVALQCVLRALLAK